jgi:hypothetical protein
MLKNNNLKGKEGDSPFTTSFTHAASAKISRLYSGRRRVSILAAGGKPEPCPERKPPRCAARSLWAAVSQQPTTVSDRKGLGSRYRSRCVFAGYRRAGVVVVRNGVEREFGVAGQLRTKARQEKEIARSARYAVRSSKKPQAAASHTFAYSCPISVAVMHTRELFVDVSAPP